MKRILIIERYADAAKPTRLLFELIGYDVLTMMIHQQLSLAIDGFDPELILIDMGFNDRDVNKVRRILKNPSLHLHVPVVHLSQDGKLVAFNPISDTSNTRPPYVDWDLDDSVSSPRFGTFPGNAIKSLNLERYSCN